MGAACLRRIGWHHPDVSITKKKKQKKCNSVSPAVVKQPADVKADEG